MVHALDNDWRFVKDSTSNADEIRQLVWKTSMLSRVCCTASIKNSIPRCHYIHNNTLFNNTEIKCFLNYAVVVHHHNQRVNIGIQSACPTVSTDLIPFLFIWPSHMYCTCYGSLTILWNCNRGWKMDDSWLVTRLEFLSMQKNPYHLHSVLGGRTHKTFSYSL
jgi:hypothetical protein